MAATYLFAVLVISTVTNTAYSREEDKLQAYTKLQEGIKEFLDGEWASLTDKVRGSPQLSKETSLLEAFNVMLSPMLVSANGKLEHAEAMSAFCYNYFQAGMEMTKDHIQKDIYLSGDSSFINQLTKTQDRMKKLQGQCISTLTTTFTHGIFHFIFNTFKSIIPF